MKNQIIAFMVVLFLMALSFHCARRGSPNGGPKDTLPPILVIAKPAYRSVNFRAKKIVLKFNEYVKFQNLNKELVISPPMKKAPIIEPMAAPTKKVYIEILDKLRPNTTYVFNFGNSLQDNNEGNKFPQFKYVFSTGKTIDSFAIKGIVIHAIKKAPVKNIMVGLYPYDKNFKDSIVYKKQPLYISNTLDSIAFNLDYLRAGKYKIIAINDKNGNYKYEPKREEIGFYEKIVEIPKDTFIKLKIFKEIPEFQIIRPLENKQGKIFFGYKGKWQKNTQIKIVGKTPKNFKSIFTKSPQKDTLIFWHNIKNKRFGRKKTLSFQVKYKKIDTIFKVLLRTTKKDSLILKTSLNGNTLHPRDSFAILSNIPMVKADKNLISVFDKDTLEVNFKTLWNKDKTALQIKFERKNDDLYYVQFLPKALKDFFGATNDTLKYRFSTLNPEKYSTIELKFKNIQKYPILVKLLDTSGKIIENKTLQKPQTLVFKDLSPSSYFVRIIFDTNKNGIWDTGNYLKQRPPEKIINFLKALKLRANWTLNETFDVNAPQIPKPKKAARDNLDEIE